MIISIVPRPEASARRAVSLKRLSGEKMLFLYSPRAEIMIIQIGMSQRMVESESIERLVKLNGRESR